MYKSYFTPNSYRDRLRSIEKRKEIRKKLGKGEKVMDSTDVEFMLFYVGKILDYYA